MLNIEEYKILAKDFARGRYDNDLDLGIWLAKWYSRTYGIALKESMTLTLHELLIEYLAQQYLEDPEMFAKEEQVKVEHQRQKEDDEWAKKVSKNNDIDPRIQELLNKMNGDKAKIDETVNNAKPIDNKFESYKPVSFGE